MSSSIIKFSKEGLITPPKHVQDNLVLEVLAGSRGYGTYHDNSDFDIVGISIPKKAVYFPSSAGLICDYDDDIIPVFKKYKSENKTLDPSTQKEYEFIVYGIAHFFKLALENSPNILDVFYFPEEYVKHITQVGHLIRDNRKMFLSKKCWVAYRSYSSSQMKKLESKNPTGKRKGIVDKFGFDSKFAGHCFRLLCYAEDIINRQTIDMISHIQEIRSIIKGEWSLDRIIKEFEVRKLSLEEKIHKCDLQEEPNRDEIRELLIRCLETHWGKIEINRDNALPSALREIENTLGKVRNLF